MATPVNGHVDHDDVSVSLAHHHGHRKTNVRTVASYTPQMVRPVTVASCHVQRARGYVP